MEHIFLIKNKINMNEKFKILNSKTFSDIETKEKGAQFSRYIQPGEIYTLNGNLGSGKTTFMKGILKGLNFNGSVTSPTYTLINEYDADYNIIHLDCYREKNLERWLNIGLTDYFDGNNIIFIEWADFIESLLPEKTKNISFEVVNDSERYIKYNE